VGTNPVLRDRSGPRSIAIAIAIATSIIDVFRMGAARYSLSAILLLRVLIRIADAIPIGVEIAIGFGIALPLSAIRYSSMATHPSPSSLPLIVLHRMRLPCEAITPLRARDAKNGAFAR
jgi:hypothetical protein